MSSPAETNDAPADLVEVANGSASVKNKLTERDMEILSKAWGCMKIPPEIDYVKLAASLGMSNHRSASNAWSSIKKKLDFPPLAQATPGSGSARKRKTPAKPKVDDEGGAGEANEDTPTKKRARATPKASKAKKEADADAEDAIAGADDVDGVPETPAKKGRPAPKAKGTPRPKAAPKGKAAKSAEKVIKSQDSDSANEDELAGTANGDDGELALAADEADGSI